MLLFILFILKMFYTEYYFINFFFIMLESQRTLTFRAAGMIINPDV